MPDSLPPELEEVAVGAANDKVNEPPYLVLDTSVLANFARHVLRRAGVPGMIQERDEALADADEQEERSDRLYQYIGKCQVALDMRCTSDPRRVGCEDTMFQVHEVARALREERDALRGTLEYIARLKALSSDEAIVAFGQAVEQARAALTRKPKESS